MVKVFYEDFQCTVADWGETGEWFGIKTGVKQRFNVSGFLFFRHGLDLRRTVGLGENLMEVHNQGGRLRFC